MSVFVRSDSDRPNPGRPNLESLEIIKDGTASCFCLDGYEPMEGALLPNQYCLDIDECMSLENPCPPNHRCQNMEGYFKCIKEGQKDSKFSPENYYLTGLWSENLPLESGQRLNHEYDQYIISLNTVYILILMNIFPILIRHSMHTRVRNLWQCEYSLKTKNYWRTRYFNR